MNRQIPAVVTPLDEHMGLDIARSLGEKGVPVYGLDSDQNAPGKYSKYSHFVKSPDPRNDEDGYVMFLVEFGKQLGCKPVLFPLSDRHVLICSRNRHILQKHYEYVMADHDMMEKLTTKDGLQNIAQDFDIPAPQSFFLTDDNHIQDIADCITYPVIIKPTESTYWHSHEITRFLRKGLFEGRAKVILCRSPDELIEAYQRISAFDSRLVVQEVVPGEDSRLVYFSFYINRQSIPQGIFSGRKFRVIPTGFGSASFVKSFYDPALKDIAFTLLASTKYQGLGGIEFKKDPRDEKYKLIEFNTRFGMWDGLSVKCGVDLPYIAYCDAIGLPVKQTFDFRTDVIWIDWQRDIRAAIEYFRKDQLSLYRWLRSLKGEKMSAIYSKNDWRPGAAFSFSLLRILFERL